MSSWHKELKKINIFVHTAVISSVGMFTLSEVVALEIIYWQSRDSPFNEIDNYRRTHLSSVL